MRQPIKALAFLAFVVFLLLPALTTAQSIPAGFVQTSATIPSLADGTFGAAWTNLSSSPQLGLLGCVSTFQTTVNGNFDAYGHFSTLLADTAQICPSPSTWTFTFTFACPVGDPVSSFMVEVPVTGGGSTEDISSEINAVLPPKPCGGGTGGNFLMSVNGTPLITSGSADLINSDSLTVTNPSTNKIQFTVVGGGGGSCGSVTGDNSSTNCGYQNRVGDTATVPADVSTFGSQLLANNSAQNMVAIGDGVGSYTSGQYGVVIGTDEAQGTSSLSCAFSDGVVLIGNTNLVNCGGHTLSPNSGVLAVGDNNINLASPNTNRLNGVYTFGESNIPDMGSTTASLSVVVGIGYNTLADLLQSSDLIGIGDTSLGGNAAYSALQDIIAIGDAAGSGIPTNSVDVIAIGDNSGDSPALYDDASTMQDFVAIGDNTVDGAEGHDVIGLGDEPVTGIPDAIFSTGNDLIGIGNHSLACNTTGSDNIGIGDYAGANGFTGSGCGNSNQTGSHNVYIGDSAGPNTTSQFSNTISIGYQAYTTASNQIVLGNASITSLILYGCSAGEIAYDDGSGTCITPSSSANIPGGALGSVPYQSAASTTALVAGVTTSGHAFFFGEEPSGSLIAPAFFDLGTYLGTNVTASSPIVATPSTLGTQISCPTCGTAGGGTSTGVNGGSTLGSLNINAIAPVADANYLALLPKISAANMIIEAPYGSASTLGVVEVDNATIKATAGVISCTTGTTSQLGCLKPDGTIITDTAGAITVPKSSSSVFGVAKVDGTSIVASSGVISATPPFSSLTSATNTGAAMVVGTGASLAASGSGTIAATTSLALASSPSGCIGGQFATGIAANGNASCATPSGTGITLTTTGVSGLSTLSGSMLNIPHYAGSGANSDITSLTGLTSLPSAGLNGYLFGNGSSAATAATTIPGSVIVGNIPGNAANLYGSPTLPSTVAGVTSTPSGAGDTRVATKGDVYNATTASTTLAHFLCKGTMMLSGTIASGNTAAIGTATCAGLVANTPVIGVFNGNVFTLGGFIPSTNGTLSVSFQTTTNTITLNAGNSSTVSQTVGSGVIITYEVLD